MCYGFENKDLQFICFRCLEIEGGGFGVRFTGLVVERGQAKIKHNPKMECGFSE